MRWIGRLLALVAALVAAPGTGTKAHAQSVHIVALGASNTEGYGVATEEAYPVQLEALLRATGVDATVSNAGLSGDTTDGMLARLDGVTRPETRIVILQPGSNDARYGSGADRESNIAAIRGRLSARGVAVIMIENSMLGELPDSEMQADGIHYTPRGYAMLAERVLPSVLAALGR